MTTVQIEMHDDGMLVVWDMPEKSSSRFPVNFEYRLSQSVGLIRKSLQLGLPAAIRFESNGNMIAFSKLIIDGGTR